MSADYVTHSQLDAAISRLETAMAQMETRLTMRMFLVMAIGNGITIGILKLWL